VYVKKRHKIREADNKRKTRTKAISDFLRRVIPDRALPSTETVLSEKQLIVPKIESKTPKTRPHSPLPSTSRETLKQGYDYDDVSEEEEGNVVRVASPPRRFLDTQFAS